MDVVGWLDVAGHFAEWVWECGRWVSVSSLLHIENIGIYTQYYRVETILIYLNNIHLRNKEIIINTVLVLNFTGSTSTV
tara:strand:+ start:5184 stop:5420 length:237 start_codon:yes stop_codon:yes gene_type:complete